LKNQHIETLYSIYDPTTDPRRNLVMYANPLIAALFNFDHDGDILRSSSLISEDAKIEKENYNVHNRLTLESSPTDSELLISFEHESIFAVYMLSKLSVKYLNKDMSVKNFPYKPKISELQRTIKEESPLYSYKIDDKIYLSSYFIAILNSTLNFPLFEDEVITKKIFNTKMREMYDMVVNDKTHFNLNIFPRFQRTLHFCNSLITEAIAGFDLDEFVITSNEIEEYRENLFQHEPVTAFHQNIILFEDYVMPEVEKKDNNIFYNLLGSGTGLKPIQLQKAISNNGVQCNIFNQSKLSNVKSPLVNGLTKKEYHESGDSARLALILRESAIPLAGGLMNRLLFQTGFLQRAHGQKCDLSKTFRIEIISDKHLKLLEGRYIKVNDVPTPIELVNLKVGDMIDLYSPHTCTLKHAQVCDICYGRKDTQTEHLGVILSCDSSEAIIQASLSSHHTGGVFMAKRNEELLEILRQSIVEDTEKEEPNRKHKYQTLLVPENLSDKYIEIITSYYQEEADTELLDVNDMILIEKVEKVERNETVYDRINLNVNYNLHAEDAEKLLHKIIGLLTSSGKKAEHIDTPQKLYYELLNYINIPSNLLSILSELLVSILFIDKYGNFMRYSKENEFEKISINNVIEKTMDSKNSILNGYSKVKASKMFMRNNNDNNEFKHMDEVFTKYYYFEEDDLKDVNDCKS